MKDDLPPKPRERIDVLPTMREIIMARQFPDEEMCVQMIARKRWGREAKCPFEGCNGKFVLRSKEGGWIMGCSRTPAHSASPYKGTLYSRSTLPLLTWFEAVDIMYRTDGKADAKMMARKLSINIITARTMREKINHALGYTGLRPKM